MSQAQSKPTKPIRILLVDDHEVVRIGLSAVLNLTPGMKVVGQASKKDEALRQCARLKPDIVLLDIRLPDGNGVDAAGDILAVSPSSRVLFLTSFADEHTVEEASLSGAHGYLLKDIASQALVRAIKTVAAGQPLTDSRITHHAPGWRTPSPSAPSPSKRPLLSPQEQRLLPLVAAGYTNKEIAQSLTLSEKTVKNYLANIYSKLQISRRSQVATFFASSFRGTPLS
ncbi:MAG: response regulator transcription factor [Nitrospira sp.]|jgi:two-component system response regulator DevR|nr:response regulator transcription factor [Nitrospira sp.]